MVVLAPATMTKAALEEMVPGLVSKVMARSRRSVRSDDDLLSMAHRIAPTIHPLIPERLTSVRWVSNQEKRWASCTPATGAIRLSDRLTGSPGWVLDHVLRHELAHLVEPGHGPAFAALIDHPDAERAEAFLAGLALGLRQGPMTTD